MPQRDQMMRVTPRAVAASVDRVRDHVRIGISIPTSLLSDPRLQVVYGEADRLVRRLTGGRVG